MSMQHLQLLKNVHFILYLDVFPVFGRVSNVWTSYKCLDVFPVFGGVSSVLEVFPVFGSVSSVWRCYL